MQWYGWENSLNERVEAGKFSHLCQLCGSYECQLLRKDVD